MEKVKQLSKMLKFYKVSHLKFRSHLFIQTFKVLNLKYLNYDFSNEVFQN